MPVKDKVQALRGPEAELIIRIARWIVYNPGTGEIGEFLKQNKINWDKFNAFADFHELSPFAYACLNKFLELVPENEIATLEKKYAYSFFHASLLWQEFLRISKSFIEQNVSFLPLKGISFIAENLYADKSFLRPLTDIDVLIKREDLLRAGQIMQRLGYAKKLRGFRQDYWLKRSYHLCFSRENSGGFVYLTELHWALDYTREVPQLASLWERTKSCRPKEGKIDKLSAEDDLLNLALNQRHFGKVLCAKNACDAALLIRRYGQGLDWEYILNEAKKSRMRASLFFLLKQLDFLFNLQMPDKILKKLAITNLRKRKVENFILRNTFPPSTKINNRLYESHIFLALQLLIFDTFFEPLKFILNVPQEQFAKFYGLPANKLKTCFFYHLRFPYFVYKKLSLRVSSKY